jgi:dihydroorotate dehydrogenase (NAD+) catalytic subunit
VLDYARSRVVPVKPNLEVSLGPLRLKNPVMTASGTFGYGLEFSTHLDLRRLGALVTKGLSPEPREGNPPQRIVETCGGMLNSIGLQNVGVEAFCRDKLPRLRELGATVVCNVFGEKVEDYVRVAERLDGEPGVAALELNVSCPNVREGGIEFGRDPRLLGEVVATVRRASRLPLITKLTPNVTDISVLARAAQDAGADVLSLVNTYTGMAVDLEKRRAVPARGVGGLSGPAIKPLALYAVSQVAGRVSVPVIGIGGIVSARDALEFLVAGARAVQVGTANYVDPAVAARILDGIEAWLAERGIRDVNEVVGTLECS